MLVNVKNFNICWQMLTNIKKNNKYRPMKYYQIVANVNKW